MRQASIFLVEDEALIRMMLADMIEELGHRVAAETGNIQDAQVLAETAIFDLAILDINIAGSSIVPVAEIIDRRGLPFLFISGYGSAARPEAFIERPALQKPLCYRSSAKQLTRSTEPLVRHRPPLTILRQRFNEPHRSSLHHVHAADRGACGDLEFARSLTARRHGTQRPIVLIVRGVT
jgi:CheY-like chemotaxis protein